MFAVGTSTQKAWNADGWNARDRSRRAIVDNKVIFLDFDGPMIPVRAYWLPTQTKPIVSIFDPVAASLVNKLIAEAQAKVVISSSWRHQGRDKVVEVLSKNGMDPTALHEDWETPCKLSSQRIHDIKWWLDDHPEVTHYVAIDDTDLDVEFIPNAVKADTYEGLSFRNYLEARLYLDAYAKGQQDDKEEHTQIVQHLKRQEIWRLKRKEEPGTWHLLKFADELFPRKKD